MDDGRGVPSQGPGGPLSSLLIDVSIFRLTSPLEEYARQAEGISPWVWALVPLAIIFASIYNGWKWKP